MPNPILLLGGRYSVAVNLTSGRSYLPKPVSQQLIADDQAAVRVQLALDDLFVEIHTNVSALAGSQPFITIPKRLLQLLPEGEGGKVPMKFVGAEPVPFKRQFVTPLVGFVRFCASVYSEGKNSVQVAVPAIWHEFLVKAGWRVVEVATFDPHNEPIAEPFIQTLSIRGEQDNVVVVALPKSRCLVTIDQELIVELRPTADAPVTAMITAEGTFSWLAFRPESCEVVPATEDRSLLVGLRSQATILNHTPLDETLWFLGLYLAEGSKTGFELSIANKSPELLQRAAEFLGLWGISRSKLVVDVVYDADRLSEAAAALLYTKVASVRSVTAITELTKRREYIGTLRVRDSLILLDMLREALTVLVQQERALWLAADAAWAFLLGYLDGDGTFTQPRTGPGVIRLFPGEPKEAHVVMTVLCNCLSKDPSTRAQKETEEGLLDEAALCDEGSSTPPPPEYRTTVTFFEKGTLLQRGAFRYSESRPRLFHSVQALAEKLTNAEPKHGAYVRWGLLEKGGALTARTQAVLEVLQDSELKEEWNYILGKFPTLEDCIGPQGKKGRLYHFKQPVGGSTTKLKKLTGDPTVHHPDAKQAQIREVLAGQKELTIYEVHGGFGYCSEAYQAFGQLTSRTHNDGDETLVTGRELAEGHVYAVVDVDPYGYSSLRLLADAIRLLRRDGFLFLTLPTGRVFSPPGFKMMAAVCGKAKPTLDELVSYIDSVGRLYGKPLALQSALNLRSVWRLAFRVEG